ncbi:MAG: hypothetical protein JXA20_04215 [Spirochaetes bacterium]|nr:hypothetical protein [Spirochaetota bacterium]
MDTAYSIHCEDLPRYVHVSLQGMLKKPDVPGFFDTLLDTLEQCPQNRVLVDVTQAAVETSMINALLCADKVSRIPRRRRVALLLKPAQRDLGENQELVYGNRGFSVRYFLNRGNALAWLEEGSRQAS